MCATALGAGFKIPFCPDRNWIFFFRKKVEFKFPDYDIKSIFSGSFRVKALLTDADAASHVVSICRLWLRIMITDISYGFIPIDSPRHEFCKFSGCTDLKNRDSLI
jgi:hypothetical protein